MLELNMLLFLAHLIAFFIKPRYSQDVKKILAMPYYPLNYAGGHSRIGDWKPYFENKGIQFDVHWGSETKEFLQGFDQDNWLKKYWFYHKVLIRRFKILLNLNSYDSIWVQRAFVPFFPFKDAFFEKIAVKFNKRVIVDFYDADYCSNYDLTLNAARYAYRVTVASLFLKHFFDKHEINTNYVRYAMNYREYMLHQAKNEAKIILGWMGAPANFKNIIHIEEELLQIEKLFPYVEFHFICRELMPLKLKRVKHLKWGDPGFDYHSAIANFDIGLAPMIHATEREKAKTSFKTLEYMAAGLSFVTSPWGISDQLVDNENCLFANSKEEWELKLSLLVKNKELRDKLAENAHKTLKQYHSYENVFQSLYEALSH